LSCRPECSGKDNIFVFSALRDSYARPGVDWGDWVAERIDDAPVLKDYIKNKVSALPEKLFFFNSAHLNRYQNESGGNKLQFIGAAYFRTIESFFEDHYTSAESSSWNSVVMPAKRRPPVSVLGVLTTDGWDPREKEFNNLYQTQTIRDISWMSIRRNRQAGPRMTIPQENVRTTCLRNIPSV